MEDKLKHPHLVYIVPQNSEEQKQCVKRINSYRGAYSKNPVLVYINDREYEVFASPKKKLNVIPIMEEFYYQFLGAINNIEISHSSLTPGLYLYANEKFIVI